MVLDRPNPIGGVAVDGPMLNATCCASGYGEFPIPHIHGMTIGELTLLFNSAARCAVPPLAAAAAAAAAACELSVVQMRGWQRDMLWADTALPWIPPSPNLPTPQAALAYGATVFLEATTVSEGRGTATPFLLFGAPFFDAAVRSGLTAANRDSARCGPTALYMQSLLLQLLPLLTFLVMLLMLMLMLLMFAQVFRLASYPLFQSCPSRSKSLFVRTGSIACPNILR